MLNHFDTSGDFLCKDYRFGIVLTWLLYIALFFHVLFIPMFYWLGVTSLAWVNVGSTAIYLLAFYLVGRGKNTQAFYLACFEVPMHSVLAVSVLGWASGFHYHTLLVAVLVFLHPSPRVSLKFGLAGTICTLYISLFFFSRPAGGVIPVDHDVIDLLNSFNIFIFFLALIFMAFLYDRAASNAEKELRVANAALDKLAKTDSLTGLLNRRYMLEILAQEVTRFKRTQVPFALIMTDIDNFKSVNDSQGHSCGDQVLLAVAGLMAKTVREQDRIARWGGEEFLIFMPETELAEARLAAERLRQRLQNHIVSYQGTTLNISMTFGISVYDGRQDVDHSILTADKALYEGKLKGKNCVVAEKPGHPAKEGD